MATTYQNYTNGRASTAEEVAAGNYSNNPYNNPSSDLYNPSGAPNAVQQSINAYMGAPLDQSWQGASSQPAPQPSQNLGFSGQGSTPAMQGYTQNPYLSNQVANMQTQSNDNWTRNLQPSIRSGAMAAGGFGGSRQGVVEANALKDQNSNLTNATANLYANDYNTAQGRNLSQYQTDLSYNLGLRGNDLGYANLDAGIAQNNTQNGINYANLGLNTYNAQQAGNTSATNAATTLQNTPYNNWQNFSQQANAAGGTGGTTTSNTAMPGNAALGALAGWNLGSGYGKTA